MARPSGTDDDDLNRAPTDEEWARLQFTTVLYYLHETNPDNGMVRDKTDPLQAIVQSVVCGERQPDRLVGHALSLRYRSGAGGADDGELPNRIALEHHAPLCADSVRLAASRLYRGLVVDAGSNPL